MIALRAALFVALLAASAVARAQPVEPADVAPSLRAAVAAYRAGDLATAEAACALAPSDPDAEAWLAPCCSIAVQTARRCVASSTPPTPARAKAPTGWRWSCPGPGRHAAQRQAAVELFEKAAAAGHRARPDQPRHALSTRPGRARRSRPGARVAGEGGRRRRSLGALHAGPRHGRERRTAVADPVRAADLYRRAAEKGHALAGLRYGLALSEGNGVKRDPVAAQRWLMYAQERMAFRKRPWRLATTARARLRRATRQRTRRSCRRR